MRYLGLDLGTRTLGIAISDRSNLIASSLEVLRFENEDYDSLLEKVKLIRKNAKEKVFVTNALRALADVSPTGNIRDMEFVVLVGGSALDFEIPQLVTDALAQYKIVAGRANIRGCEGPRNAVATGLILSSIEEGEAIG